MILKNGLLNPDGTTISEFTLNVFKWGTPPSVRLQPMVDQGVLAGNLAALDDSDCLALEGVPDFVDRMCFHFAEVDNGVPSSTDETTMPFSRWLDLMINAHGTVTRVDAGKSKFSLPGNLAIATTIHFLVENQKDFSGLIPQRVLLRTFPEEDTVLVLLTEIERGELKIYLHRLPSFRAGLHYEGSAVLLTRPDPVEGKTTDGRQYALHAYR